MSNKLFPEENLEDYFKVDFVYFYEELGLSGKEVLNKLHEMGLTELKLFHIYYFANKYGLRKRNQKRIPRENKVNNDLKKTDII